MKYQLRQMLITEEIGECKVIAIYAPMSSSETVEPYAYLLRCSENNADYLMTDSEITLVNYDNPTT